MRSMHPRDQKQLFYSDGGRGTPVLFFVEGAWCDKRGLVTSCRRWCPSTSGHHATDCLAGEPWPTDRRLFVATRRHASDAQQATSTESFRRYVEAFQTLDPRAALRYLHIPFIFADDRGARVLRSATAAEALLTNVMDALRIRGYARRDIDDLHVHPLNRHAAIISVNRIRYTRAGAELERVGETYTLVQTEETEWKSVVAIVHDAPAVLQSQPSLVAPTTA